MNNNFNVGIIGLGVGEHHLLAYSKNKNCNIIAVCDFDKKKQLSYKKRFPNINFTSNYLDIVRDKKINIVSIASYDNFHFKQFVECIKAKKHIFIEKDISITSAPGFPVSSCFCSCLAHPHPCQHRSCTPCCTSPHTPPLSPASCRTCSHPASCSHS